MDLVTGLIFSGLSCLLLILTLVAAMCYQITKIQVCVHEIRNKRRLFKEEHLPLSDSNPCQQEHLNDSEHSYQHQDED